MPIEYKCCLCQVVSANCTRKCLICASEEKRICNTCLARHNKCSECRGGDTTTAVVVQDSSKESAPKRKKNVEQATKSASAINAVATTAQHESSTSSAIQAVVVTSPTTAAENAASALRSGSIRFSSRKGTNKSRISSRNTSARGRQRQSNSPSCSTTAARATTCSSFRRGGSTSTSTSTADSSIYRVILLWRFWFLLIKLIHTSNRIWCQLLSFLFKRIILYHIIQ